VPRILIAESDEAARDDLRDILAQDSAMEVVDDVDEGSELLELIGPLNVDLLLLDNELSGVEAADVTGRLRQRHPRLGIVMMGSSPSGDRSAGGDEGRG